MTDKWLPIAHAVAELANGGVGREALLRHLKAGTVKAKARALRIDTYHRSSESSPRFPKEQADAEIPLWFWRACDWSPDYVPTLDWRAGDFEGRAQERGTSMIVTALGVTVAVEGVRAMLTPAPTANALTSRSRKGTRSYAAADAPLIERMHKLVESGEAPSPTAAAGMLVAEATGLGDDESKVRRLQRSYAKLHG